MWYVVAAGAAAGKTGGLSDEVIISIVGLLVAVVTVLGGVAVALINTKKGPAPSDDLGNFRERLAVVEEGVADSDDRDEVQDRRLENHTRAIDQIQRHLDVKDPGWRRD